MPIIILVCFSFTTSTVAASSAPSVLDALRTTRCTAEEVSALSATCRMKTAITPPAPCAPQAVVPSAVLHMRALPGVDICVEKGAGVLSELPELLRRAIAARGERGINDSRRQVYV